MIRLFMIAMLLSTSIYAVDSHHAATTFPRDSKKHCKECKRGHVGNRGPRGQDGTDGPTGPTGAAGLSTPNIIVPFTIAGSDIIGSINPPFLGRVVAMPWGGSPLSVALSSNGPSGPELLLRSGELIGYNISQNKTIVSIAATFTLHRLVDVPLVGSEIIVRAETWVADSHSLIFKPSGAGVDFPALIVPETPSDLNNTTVSAGPVALNVPVPAGSTILMTCSMTSTDPDPIRIVVMCTAGISMN